MNKISYLKKLDNLKVMLNQETLEREKNNHTS